MEGFPRVARFGLGGGVEPEVARASRTPSLFGSRAGSLEELRAEIGDCRRCKLHRSRTQIVFGVGNPRADLMFVGEAPGRDEDLQGEPFVGRAGQLLTEIITKGMGLRREDVYIANVVKCRPPENRNPEPDEIASCEPFLRRQIELVRPKVLVALGKFAAQTLLGTTAPISKLRGVWHEYHGTKLMPTLHPAYLLRNPADKKLVWEDIKQVMRELGLGRP
ncbi:MAG: uracil-DNA glycosylase [Candidatus Binatia bacterium]|nr:MAG: uracil-DNA glycosylase [Candidatus Binatia bacterium]